jgi:DNA-binding transcriptional ArsR family regulator
VEVFAMLADATRVRIILALRDGELPVNHLADIVDKTPAAVSRHLARMRLTRLSPRARKAPACSTGSRMITPGTS